MPNAIQDGIYNSSTKRRLDELEERKEALETEIANEQLIKPLLEPKKLKFYFINLRKLDTTKLEDRRSLINNFVNAVVLHDDRIDFVFNYQDGTKTVTFEELKEESADSSDLLVSARPRRRGLCIVRDDFSFEKSSAHSCRRSSFPQKVTLATVVPL